VLQQNKLVIHILDVRNHTTITIIRIFCP
jgi:hypothetical protein